MGLQEKITHEIVFHQLEQFIYEVDKTFKNEVVIMINPKDAAALFQVPYGVVVVKHKGLRFVLMDVVPKGRLYTSSVIEVEAKDASPLNKLTQKTLP